MSQKKARTKPRTAHYLFAHTALRQICDSDPKYFFKAFVSSDQEIYLQRILDQVKEHCQDDPADFGVKDINITTTRNSTFPMLVFSMPEPKAYSECYNVALLLIADINRQAEDVPVQYRCYTQELTQTEDGEDCTSFCEWQGETHLQHGVMQNNSIEDFAQAIKHQLTLDLAES
jgi:hypothetical protein